jgi:hypothetical protein
MVAGWRRDLSSADSPLDARRHGLIHCAVEGGAKHARRILLIPLTSITTVAFATWAGSQANPMPWKEPPMPSDTPEGEICAPPAPTCLGAPRFSTRSFDSNAKE